MKTVSNALLLMTLLIVVAYFGCTNTDSSSNVRSTITVVDPGAADEGVIGQEMSIR